MHESWLYLRTIKFFNLRFNMKDTYVKVTGWTFVNQLSLELHHIHYKSHLIIISIGENVIFTLTVYNFQIKKYNFSGKRNNKPTNGNIYKTKWAIQIGTVVVVIGSYNCKYNYLLVVNTTTYTYTRYNIMYNVCQWLATGRWLN